MLAVLTSEEMLIVLLDVENNCASQLDLCEEVKVSQDEKDLALRFELCYHKLLVSEQVIFFRFTFAHISVHIVRVVQDFILAVLPIPQRKDIVSTLDHEEWKVKVS